MANPQNLKPIKTAKEAREKGRIGGIKSGEAKRKKKLLSEMYADFLEKNEDKIKRALEAVTLRGDAASVSVLKEMREATEGQKITHSGDAENPVKIIINPVGD